VTQFCQTAGIPEKEQFQINLALDELFTNIISHGFPDDREHRVAFTVELRDGEVRLTIEDDGVPFNPLDLPAPDLKCALKEREVGGLGLTIIKAFMDRIAYRRKGGRNVTTMTKRLGA
jgi:serine/threonine-protein kinase RsbW